MDANCVTPVTSDAARGILRAADHSRVTRRQHVCFSSRGRSPIAYGLEDVSQPENPPMPRTTVSLDIIELPRDQVDELATIYPEGRVDDYRFRCRLPEGDDKLSAILEWLHGHGLKPFDVFVTKSGERDRFRLARHREYDAADFAGVRYARLWPTARGNGLFRDERGRVKMIEGDFPRRADLVRTPLSWVVVPDRVKAVIDAERFRGVAFRPTVLVGGSKLPSEAVPKPWSRFGEPWWELTSDVVLPPLSPTMEVYDEVGNLVSGGDCSGGCYPREGHYVQPEYRYRAEDLARVEPFDFARTAEVFGCAGHTDTWHYVGSRQIRELCLGHKWKCDWIPVRLGD